MKFLRPPTRAEPYPYDLVLIDPAGQRLGCMLVADPYDVESEKQKEQESVVPTDYSPTSRDPFVEGTRRFRNWVFGAGERLRRGEGEQQSYYLADGVDASCGGIAHLGPESTTVTPSGAGTPAASPITLIHEWPGVNAATPTPHLYAIDGQQILVNAGDPATAADWSVSKNFSTALGTPTISSVTPTPLPTPVISLVTANGTDNTVTYGYEVRAIGAANPPRSAMSAEVTTTHGATVLSGGDNVDITWASVAGATNYEVWRTTGGTAGKIYSGPLFAFNDAASGSVITAGAPPAGALNGSTTYGYRVVATGSLPYPHSARSGEVTTAAGAAVLTSASPNAITWGAVTDAVNYQVWRTTGGVTGLIATIPSPTVTYSDSAGSTPSGTAPATSAETQTPTDLYSHTYNGVTYLYAGMDFGAFWFTSDGSTWTQHVWSGSHFTSTAITFYRSAVSATATDVHVAPTWVYSTALAPYDPIVAWTAVTAEGQNRGITKLLNARGLITVFSRDQIKILGGAEVTPTPTIASDDNGRTAALFGGSVYATFGGEWYQITPTSSSTATVEAVGLGRMVENLSSIKGANVASAGHNSWFNYFTIYNGTDTYLWKLGSWLNPNETSTHRFEFANHLHGSIAKWASRRAYSMLVSSISGSGTVGNPRLLIGMDNGTFRIITLPIYTPSPLADSSCRFQTSGSMQLGIDDAGFAANEKNYHRATVIGPDLTTAKTASLDYDLDGSGTYTALAGTFTRTGSSVTFPEDVETQGHQIQLRLDLASNANTATPQVDEVQLHAQVLGPTDESGNPGFVRDRTLTILCNDGILNNKGKHITEWTGQQLRDRLQGFVARAECTLILQDGVRRACSISGYHEGETYGRNGERRQVVHLKLTETTLATQANAVAGQLDPGWGP